MTIRFDLGHELDLEFSRSNMEFAISQPKKVRLPRNKKQTISNELRASNVTNGFDLAMTLIFEYSRPNVVKFCNSCISEWEGRLTLNKGGGSRSFMIMTVTIW